MKGYILGSSQGSDKEKALIDKINRKGGTRFVEAWAGVEISLLMGSFVLFLARWTPALTLLGAVASLAAGLWFYTHSYKVYLLVKHRELCVTANPELIELDKAWLAAVKAEKDPGWRLSIDQERYVRVRQLAEMTTSDAAPLIQTERKKLRSHQHPPE